VSFVASKKLIRSLPNQRNFYILARSRQQNTLAQWQRQSALQAFHNTGRSFKLSSIELDRHVYEPKSGRVGQLIVLKGFAIADGSAGTAAFIHQVEKKT
jgi:hypothetical protein